MRNQESQLSPRSIDEISDKVKRNLRYRTVDDLSWNQLFKEIKIQTSTSDYQKAADMTKDIFSELRSREASKETGKKHERYLKTERWKKRRKEKLEQENYTCEKCGDKATEAHHTTYRNLDSVESEAEINDLVALCSTCHRKWHGKIPSLRETAPPHEQREVENIMRFNKQEITSYKELKKETNDPKRLRWINKEVDRLKQENQELEGGLNQ